MTERNFSSRVSKLLLSLWLPLCILLLGYSTANHFVSLKQAEQQQRIKQEVMQRLNLIADGVRDNIALYEYGLRGARAAVMTVTPEQLSYQLILSYSQNRDYSHEFPGARGFGIIRYLNPNEKAIFLAKMAKERPGFNFTIEQFQPHNDSLFVIQYIEPEQRNLEAIGFDIGSEPMRRKAALDAALTNESRLTAPVTLVQANEKTQQGFLILLPIYYTSSIPTAPEARLAQLYGLSYAPILIDEVLSTVSGLQSDVTLAIADVTDTTPLTFFQRGQAAEHLIAHQQQLNMNLLGRHWQLTLTPSQVFINKLQLPSKGVLFREILGASLVIALIVFLVQLLIMRRTQKMRHKAELSHITENTLKQANIELEQLVDARTNEISRVNALQRSILSGAGYAIIATDTSGFITAFNPAAERLLGYQASEVLQKCTPAIFHLPDELQRYAVKLRAELGKDIHGDFESLIAKAREGRVESKRWTYVTKQGASVQVKLNISALTDEYNQRVGYLGIAFDLTEQLQRESELAQAKEQAEIANQAKSDFLANMSHEIRTPMNAILGLLQLTANTQLDNRQADYIEKTQRAATSLLTLLNDILDFSKVEAGKLELDPHPFSLPTLLQDISILLSSGAQEKELELLYHIAADVPQQLLGDSLRIKQILLNLAGNAIKFTEHGEVIISIRAQRLPQNQLKLLCSVRDTGIGMSPEQQKSIFSGFHQAESSISRRYGGTGLGLSISKRLINLMDGTIAVQSELGLGSEFTFDLTLHQAAEDNPSQTHLLKHLPADLKVLIVDDNDNARLILQEMAGAFGWQVDTAQSAEQAITLVEQASKQQLGYALIFVDWQMPTMDGLAFAEYVKLNNANKPAPKVVMISAYGKEILTKHTERTDQLLDGFLIKPITHDMMLTAVYSAIHENPITAPTAPKLNHDIPLSNITLLLVEDNATNQLVASELLASQGAIVDIASSGEQALTMLAQQPTRYDIVLMDIQMPEMDGYQTTQHIRQQPQLANLPIIAMTANALPSDKAACLAAGMQDHIAKPFSLDEVVTKTLKHCQRAASFTLPSLANVFNPQVLSFCQQQHISLQQAYARLGYSAELYTKVLRQFSADLQHCAEQLRQENISVKTAMLLFHSLNGAASTVGFTVISQLAAAQEQRLKENNNISTLNLDTTLASISAYQAIAITLLKLLDDETASEKNNTASLEMLSDQDIQAQLQQLMLYLNSANMAALPLFRRLSHTLQASYPTLVHKLNQEISALAFDAAAAILKPLLNEK